MDGYQTNGHAVYDIKYHMIWVTKYRYGVLKGRIGRRTRELIRQGCQARRITILQESVGKDHVHILVSCPTSLAPSKIIQYLKGRSSRLLQEEFPELQKRYWGAASVGKRLLLCNRRDRDRGNHPELHREPGKRWKG